MSSKNTKNDLTLSINELKELLPITKESKNMTSEISNKISELIDKIVNSFYLILTEHFQNEENVWNFISKHVNKPVTKFCIIYEKNDLNEEENDINSSERKGKNWILLSILEKSFFHSMKEIFLFQESQKNNIIENNQFMTILKDLNNMDFSKIFNEDYEKYLAYLEANENESFHGKEELFNQSPIWEEKSHRENVDENINKENEMDSIYQEYDLNLINIKSEVIFDFSNKESELSLIELTKNRKEYEKSKFAHNIEKPEEFEFKKKADLGPSIVENFYNFIPKIKSGKSLYDEQGQNSNIIINSINDDEPCINNHLRDLDMRKNSGLKLYTEDVFRHFPSDELYESRDSNYNIKNRFFDQNVKKVKNTRLLYMNDFYKKATFFKFDMNTFHDKSTSLKEQNYQCYICLKKFSHFLDIPLEAIYWCSYYMRFVCKNCIADEYSIIPQFILKEWCFDKFSISKKAKNLINFWYDKPIIYLKKEEEILKKIPEQVLRIKKNINKIFNFMKCEDVFDFVEKKIPQYKYILLKEKIFSLKNLIEMHNSSNFIKILKNIEELLINHIHKECKECKYEGEICLICQNEEKIYFYDTKNIFYCNTCSKSFHRGCISLEHHNH